MIPRYRARSPPRGIAKRRFCTTAGVSTFAASGFDRRTMPFDLAIPHSAVRFKSRTARYPARGADWSRRHSPPSIQAEGQLIAVYRLRLRLRLFAEGRIEAQRNSAVATTPLRISARCNPPGTDPAGVPKTGTASRSRSSASLHGVVFDIFWSRSWSLAGRRADCSVAEIRRRNRPPWRISAALQSALQVFERKIFLFPFCSKQSIHPFVSFQRRGVSRSSRTRNGMRWTRRCRVWP